jgi:hypothetical protein
MSTWQSFFSHSVGCHLSLVTVFFDVQKFFNLMQSSCSYMQSLLSSCEEVVPYTYLFQCMFCCLLELFQNFRLILRSLICFEFILVWGERQGYSLSLLHVDIQFSQQHLLKNCLISIMCFVLLCYRRVGLCLDCKL